MFGKSFVPKSFRIPRIPTPRRRGWIVLGAFCALAAVGFWLTLRAQWTDLAAADAGVPARAAMLSASPRAHAFMRPLLFEANAGQTDARVRFLARGQGYAMFLTDDGALLRTGRRVGRGVEAHVMALHLIGAAPATPIGSDPSGSRANYLLGSSAAQGQRSVAEYQRVSYPAIYPGVDLVYYGRQGQLEYDFNVAPGGKPQAIRFQVAGSQDVQLTAQGDLRLVIGGQAFYLRKPVAYQMIAGQRRPVAARFRRQGDAVSFALGAFDPNQVLTIDPVLSFSTYLGGTGNDQANAVAVDAAGDAYVVGTTLSTDFPVTTGVVQGKSAGSFDVFVSEVDPTGAKLLFSSYLGGTDDDEGTGVAVDGSGNIFVTGFTLSADFPVTTGAFQTKAGGGYDAFVAKLAPGGASLLYSTYLGGSGDDQATGIVLDGSGNAFISGYTASGNFPVSAGAAQSAFGGKVDGFLAEIKPSGGGAADLAYATYLGGNGVDKATSVAMDGSGNVYVAGFTASPNFPATAAAFQTAWGGSYDAFVAKYSHTGTLEYATYLGGSGDDEANAVAVDAAGDVFVAGYTVSANFPVTPGAYRTTQTAASDVFVSELNRSGSALSYSTYMGGSGSDIANGVAVDANGNAYVTGATSSNDFPVTATASQAALGGNNDAFLFKLDAIGSHLLYSSYMGGTGVDQGTALAIDKAGDIYVVGATGSGNFPVTSGVLQGAAASAQDAFVVKMITAAVGAFTPDPLSFPAQSVGSTSAAEAVQLTNAGELNLTIGKIAATGPFAETNNCGATLVPNASCVINVTFSPTATGAATGALTVTDSAPGGSQSMALTGTGGNFSLSVTPTSSTVTAGSTSSYQLTVTPANGYSQVVALTCSGAPTGTTCTPSPASLTMNGTSSSTAVFTVTTSAGALPPGPVEGPGRGTPWLYLLLAVCVLGALWLVRPAWQPVAVRRRRWALAGVLGLFLMTVAWVGCGSSSSTTPKTPAGTYNLTFTGTAGSTTQTIQVNLTVN